MYKQTQVLPVRARRHPSTAMALKRKCGFENVSTDIFRKSLLKKGQKLWGSGHVLDLEEENELLDENSDPAKQGLSTLCGLVLPQTSVSKKPYNVKIKVTKQRKIAESHCECKAGLSFCKHKAAVLIAVNEEEPQTKTSLPQLWGKPSNTIQQLYKKGHSIQQLFKQKTSLACPLIQKTPPLHYLKTLPCNPRPSVLSYMLKAESVEPDQRIVNDLLEELVINVDSEVEKEKIRMLCSEIFMRQDENKLLFPYYVSRCSDKKLLLLKLKYEINRDVAFFYNNNISCSPEMATKICLKTVKQSENKDWFSERSIRISSTTAHRIKTRQADFENLSFKLVNKTGNATAAMKYG